MRFAIALIALGAIACQSKNEDPTNTVADNDAAEKKVCISEKDRVTPRAKVDPAKLTLSAFAVTMIEETAEDGTKIPVAQLDVQASTETTVVAYKACPKAGGRCIHKHTTARNQIIPELKKGTYTFTAYPCRWDGGTTTTVKTLYTGGGTEGSKLTCGPKTKMVLFDQPSTPTAKEFAILVARSQLENEMDQTLSLIHERVGRLDLTRMDPKLAAQLSNFNELRGPFRELAYSREWDELYGKLQLTASTATPEALTQAGNSNGCTDAVPAMPEGSLQLTREMNDAAWIGVGVAAAGAALLGIDVTQAAIRHPGKTLVMNEKGWRKQAPKGGSFDPQARRNLLQWFKDGWNNSLWRQTQASMADHWRNDRWVDFSEADFEDFDNRQFMDGSIQEIGEGKVSWDASENKIKLTKNGKVKYLPANTIFSRDSGTKKAYWALNPTNRKLQNVDRLGRNFRATRWARFGGESSGTLGQDFMQQAKAVVKLLYVLTPLLLIAGGLAFVALQQAGVTGLTGNDSREMTALTADFQRFAELKRKWVRLVERQ